MQNRNFFGNKQGQGLLQEKQTQDNRYACSHIQRRFAERLRREDIERKDGNQSQKSRGEMGPAQVDEPFDEGLREREHACRQQGSELEQREESEPQADAEADRERRVRSEGGVRLSLGEAERHDACEERPQRRIAVMREKSSRTSLMWR